MELEPDYTFVPLAPRHYMGIENKDTQHCLRKWGLLGNVSIQDFVFNEPFQPYNKYHIAEKFFKDPQVVNNLLLKEGDSWVVKGIKAASVEVTPVPCTVLNMLFFDKLSEPENNIVRPSGQILKRFDMDINGFLVPDNLRGLKNLYKINSQEATYSILRTLGEKVKNDSNRREIVNMLNMLLDEECDAYSLYSPEEREEFIFRLFEMLVLGGSLCQYEDELKPYLEVTKKIYKDLVRVHKSEQSYDLSVGTTALQVVAKDPQGEAFFPSKPEHRQNIGFLLIDGSARQITTFLHQFGSFHW